MFLARGSSSFSWEVYGSRVTWGRSVTSLKFVLHWIVHVFGNFGASSHCIPLSSEHSNLTCATWADDYHRNGNYYLINSENKFSGPATWKITGLNSPERCVRSGKVIISNLKFVTCLINITWFGPFTWLISEAPENRATHIDKTEGERRRHTISGITWKIKTCRIN